MTMHPRLERLPPPAPDYRRFLQVLRREIPDRIPLIELGVHPEVVAELLAERPDSTGDRQRDEWGAVERNVRLHHRLGYDVVKVSARIPWDVRRLVGRDDSDLSLGDGTREWANESQGPIGTMEDFERFPWPEPKDIDWGPVERAAEILPEGMALIGFAGGVLEFSMDLLGMENFMIATLRDPDLVARVVERVGRIVHGIFETYCRMDSVRALWLGDDLGHKHGLMLSPAFLEAQILPWHQRFARLSHAHGRPFLLHSCGRTEAIMPALVESVQIDAKHSFEDMIQPVERFMDQWGDRVAVLGGVDVHILSTGSESAIRNRVREILDHVAPRGGYACGSGNSIPNYVSAENYLAMIESVAEFNGAC
jgi:uroporphyrinogen decarboxylase